MTPKTSSKLNTRISLDVQSNVVPHILLIGKETEQAEFYNVDAGPFLVEGLDAGSYCAFLRPTEVELGLYVWSLIN